VQAVRNCCIVTLFCDETAVGTALLALVISAFDSVPFPSVSADLKFAWQSAVDLVWPAGVFWV
jgi:hypothetical protein